MFMAIVAIICTVLPRPISSLESYEWGGFQERDYARKNAPFITAMLLLKHPAGK